VELMGLVLGYAARTVSFSVVLTFLSLCHIFILSLLGSDDLVKLMGLGLGNAAHTVSFSVMLHFCDYVTNLSCHCWGPMTWWN
jgi:hypothetical protein